MCSVSQATPDNLAAADTIPSTFSAWASACFLYSIGVYSSWLGATESRWNGSVTVMAVILAPISLAKRTPCSTALAARSDPSVGIRMFLRCGHHNVATYVAQVNAMKREFLRYGAET